MKSKTYLDCEEIEILKAFMAAMRLTKSDYGTKRGLEGQSGIAAFNKRKIKRKSAAIFLEKIQMETNKAFSELKKIQF